jgi:hypothetical protein
VTLSFDPGYGQEPFASLCDQAPDASVYPYDAFRTEWGPIFHRGRLDGSARLLCIGQDPAEQEAVARRILVGTAGHRAQGFLAKLGLTRSYVLINAFLYSVYGQASGNANIKAPGIVAYRHAWFSAVLASGAVEAVVSFGSLADEAWQGFVTAPEGQAFHALPYRHVAHPTSPEAPGGTPAQIQARTKAMLAAWNTALTALHAAIQHPDAATPLVPYGDDFLPAELPSIPSWDLPAGTPAWMQGDSGWGVRTGATAAQKRRTITVTVPDGVIPGD